MTEGGSRWCRGCGSAPAAGEDCGACGTGLDPPDHGSARIGRVVLRRGLRARLLLAVAERAGEVLVLDQGAEPAAIPADQFDRLPDAGPPPATARSAAGRLWAAEAARAEGQIKGRWDPKTVRTAALHLASSGLGARRAAAMDLIALGLPLPAELDLSESEVTWYRAHHAVLAGDLLAGLEQMRKLPAGRYPAQVPLLLSRFEQVATDPSAAGIAVAVLAPFAARSLDAAALVAVLDPSRAGDAEQIARRYAGLVGEGSVSGPWGAALTAYLDGLSGVPPALTGAVLGRLPVPLLDHLVDSGALAEAPPGLPPAAADHLLCRLTPERADTATLLAAGFVGEVARRAYLARDTGMLARLPDDDEAVRHYRALRDYLDTGRLDEEALRAGTAAMIRQADAVSIDFPGRRLVSDAVVADRTTWSLFWRNVTLNKVVPDAGVRERHPQFALWLDLWSLYPVLQARRWQEVTEIGQAVARHAEDPGTRAEALNLAAYAQWQLGRDSEALSLLDQALTMKPVVGLAVNAALIADDRGHPAALPYLARAMRLANDGALRDAAIGRALDLWEAKDADLPPQLRAMTRAALTLPIGDGLQHRLLQVALRHDRFWLAGGAAKGRGAAQQATARYYGAKAAFEAGPTTQAFAAVAAALGAVRASAASAAHPAWVPGELDWFLGTLDTVVAQGAGATIDAAPAVEELVRREVLGPAEGILLGAAVGARLIEAAEWSPRSGTLPGERLLFAAVDTFRHRRDDLGADEVRTVLRELGRIVENAAIRAGNAGVDFENALPKRWLKLQRSAAATWKENQPNMAERRALVKVLRAHAERCDRYLDLLVGLPVRAEIEVWLSTFVSQAREHITYLLRQVG